MGGGGMEAVMVRVTPVPALGGLAALDYRVPAALGAVGPGMRVLVPIGARRRMAVVIEVVADTPHRARLKDVLAVLDATPVLDAPLLQLVRWMAEYYLAPIGEAVATALPGPLRIETTREIQVGERAVDLAALRGVERAVLEWVHASGPQPLETLRQRWGAAGVAAATRLRRRGQVRIVERLRHERAPTAYARSYEAVGEVDGEPLLARRPALRQLYAYLRAHPLRRAAASELRHSFPDAPRKLRELLAAGLVRCHTEERYRSVLPPVGAADRRVTLTAAQAAAVRAATEATGFAPFVLHGVTGSGKTEVYLHAIAAARARGGGALVLVPEISLTHQVVDRVRARFGDGVAVLHSQLSVGERWDEWRRIARGQAPIVIGARSAVFAPVPRLALVVVDEEHDEAYKQADGVRYHGRDVAVMRAKLCGCPVLLGSATPSMESFHNAQQGRYGLLELPERVAARPLPTVELLDLRARADRAVAGRRDAGRREQADPAAVFSPRLVAALEANLAGGGQSLLFLNRRGFARVLQCRACGDPVTCPNCSVPLTWHRQWAALRCHYCDHTVPRPFTCPACAEPALEVWGVGTEQIESVLRQRFPTARIARMDRDTTRRRGSQLALLEAWRDGRIDILVGTQMIAKGHDVPGVTLVGVLLADLSLSFPDFRAGERTFQLLAQVAGRAGRGERPGRVLVQTLQPAHYSLQAASRHAFAEFAAGELRARAELGYPPFARLVLVRVEGERLADVETTARAAAAALRERAARRFAVLGPAPAPLERLRQRYRWQMLVRGRNGPAIRTAVAEVLAALRGPARRRGVRVLADVDPYGML